MDAKLGGKPTVGDNIDSADNPNPETGAEPTDEPVEEEVIEDLEDAQAIADIIGDDYKIDERGKTSSDQIDFDNKLRNTHNKDLGVNKNIEDGAPRRFEDANMHYFSSRFQPWPSYDVYLPNLVEYKDRVLDDDYTERYGPITKLVQRPLPAAGKMAEVTCAARTQEGRHAS